MQGLFDLLGVEDLCAKLEHDYARLQTNGADVFAAFDFLVTAWHLLEWKYPGSAAQSQRTELAKEYPILAVCEHLAVAGKHFEPKNPKLQAVKSSGRDAVWKRGSWAPGVWATNVWKDDLVIVLSGHAKDRLGDSLTMPRLAELVMEFWRGPAGGCTKDTGVSGSAM